MDSVPQWELEADYIETCNRDFGCPCNFNGLPTGGRCEAIVGYHSRSGNFGGVRLDGLDFVMVSSWLGAIHEGNGTVRIYVTERATPDQRAALTEIVYGRAGGNGPFAVFAGTFSRAFGPDFVPVEMRVEGKRSGFAVPGVLEARVTPHVDPVSHKEADVQMVLPHGFIWKRAHVVKPPRCVSRVPRSTSATRERTRSFRWLTTRVHRDWPSTMARITRRDREGARSAGMHA